MSELPETEIIPEIRIAVRQNTWDILWTVSLILSGVWAAALNISGHMSCLIASLCWLALSVYSMWKRP